MRFDFREKLTTIIVFTVLYVILFFAVIFLQGCQPPEQATYIYTTEEDGEINFHKFDEYKGLKRLADEEYGIVCYVLFQNAVDCIPIP